MANVTLGVIETVSKFLIGCTSNVFLLLFLIACGLLLAGMVMYPATLFNHLVTHLYEVK